MKPSKLKLQNKIGYGFVESGITAVQLLTQIYLLKFYTEVIGLSPSLAGIALSISVIWDAITDPVMGMVSDRTHSRWGRRRPYILLGGFILAISVYILFHPPLAQSQWGMFWILLSTYILVNTSMTVLSVPHIALSSDLTTERNERTELFGWRLLFSNIGMLVGMIVPAIILTSLGDEKDIQNITVSREIASVCIAGLLIVGSVITFLLSAERKVDSKEEPSHDKMSLVFFFKSFWEVGTNKVFLPLFLAFLIATLGRTFNSTIALYYYEFRLGLKESDVVIQILLPFFVIIILSIGFWIWISRRFGKKIPAFFGVFLLGVMTVIAYPLFPYGEIRPPLLVAILGGTFAGSIFLFDSILSDIIDYDRLKTGKEREGLYFGFWKMGTKFSQAFGLALAGFLLEAIGLEKSSSVQTPEVSFRLALLFGPLVGFFFITGSVVFLFMPLNDKKHIQVQRILQKKADRKSK